MLLEGFTVRLLLSRRKLQAFLLLGTLLPQVDLATPVYNDCRSPGGPSALGSVENMSNDLIYFGTLRNAGQQSCDIMNEAVVCKGLATGV